jgi:hypothetical protein
MFDFEVHYVPGTENILSDALLRIYSNEAPGTVRTPSEYTEYDNTSQSLEKVLKHHCHTFTCWDRGRMCNHQCELHWTKIQEGP